MPKQFLHFDEIEDVLSSLDLLALVVPLVKKQPSYWKWAIVAAHAGLQGAMVCALRDTASISVLDEKSARKTLQWLEKGTGEPKERLADFSTLLTRCCKADCMDGQPLRLSSAQSRDIRRLHDDFRNNFAHFVPKTWFIEKAGLRRIIRAVVDTIEMLMGHSRVLYKLSDNKKRRVAHRLKLVQARLA